jgi:hypothetical protein
MTTLDMFKTCRNKDGYKKTWLGADWKIVGDIMYFQQSRGKLDWTFNILSAFRIPGRLGKTWFLFPFGAWCMWKTLKKVIKKNPVKAYVGYSQGGWFASYASAMTTRPAFTFGCPKLGKGQAYLFGNVTHRKNPGDVVTMVPPWAEIYGQVMILNKQIERPDGLSEIEWLSHHAPEEYIARLT